jgi:hypothetical protein
MEYKMKTINGKLAVASGNNKEKYPQCSFCDVKKSLMYYTENNDLVCSECAKEDDEKESNME